MSGPPGERPGDQIGAYRLLEVLGEGGFGTVWLAERREPFVQRVALKIIKAGMDTKAVIARFEQERQALAVMDHPGVAKVHDAGSTNSGRPYFVMEHVQGEPITDYCDKHRLTIRQRLEIFIPVCEAVQHAHHKGIIHRDLKPSNILVASQGERPVPKVIDFGVAKAVSRTLTDKTIFTETGQLIGTPEYMSPEQAEMRGSDIDTRSDVYSLGAVLYQLLTGEMPFESKALRGAGYEGIVRMIREVDPPKPSTRLTSLAAYASAEIAQHRRSGRSELALELKRELDWIPLKAMRKDRTERYSSPADLARDIRNYLEGRPLEAGPESAAYRFRKLVRRNRGLFAAGGAIAAAVLLGLIGFAWQAYRIGVERDATAVERDRAQAVTAFVVKSLQSQDPHAQGAQEMTVAQAMAQAAAGIGQGDLADQPETAAVLLRTISEIMNGNGRSTEAVAPAERALKLERELHSGDSPGTARSLNTLACALMAVGRADEAEALFAEAVAMNRRLHKGDHEDLAESINNLAVVLEMLGRADEAEPLYVECIEMTRRLFPGDHADLASTLINLAGVRFALGRAAEAEPLALQALEMHERIFKGDHPEISNDLNSLAGIRQSLGRLAEAERLFVQALEMNQRLFKGDHPTVANSLNNLASVRRLLGRPDQSEALLVQALEMRRRLFKGDHPDVANSLNNLASLRQALGRAAEAEPMIVEALEMHQRLFPGDHPDVALGLANLAGVREALGHPAEAEALFVQALDMRRRLYEGDHPDTARSLINLAANREGLGRAGEARPLYEESLAMRQRLYKGDHPDVATSLYGLAGCLSALHQYAEAVQRAAQARDMADRLLPEGHPTRKKCDELLAEVKGKLAAAEGAGSDARKTPTPPPGG